MPLCPDFHLTFFLYKHNWSLVNARYFLLLFVCCIECALFKSTAQTQELLNVEAAFRELEQYRAELNAFRSEFGGSRDLPDVKFFLFGMGLRTKYLYKEGVLMNALSGEVIRKWDLRDELILPQLYTVILRLKHGGVARIVENEQGVWLIEEGSRAALNGTKNYVKLPTFDGKKYPRLLRALHQELLVNITDKGPVPNFFVYDKPWYRDAAMMALALKETGNLDCIKNWILNLREPFDRNNAGKTEADNLGQALFLVSLVSNTNHPLVEKVLAEIPRFERQRNGSSFIQGLTDFAEHPVYQTKWLKYGLRALGLPDRYTIPLQKDGYSALFWMDYRDAYIPGDYADRENYPYLGWACDHFHRDKKSPISNRDYPLTWEQNASQANYSGLQLLSPIYMRKKLAAPHTWHAAEVFLYVLEFNKGRN